VYDLLNDVVSETGYRVATEERSQPPTAKPYLAPRRSLPHGKRIFDLNLSDRVEGVWDENIPLVQQTIIEGVGISDVTLKDKETLETICEELCRTFQLTVIESHYHHFDPGISGVFILGESHLAFHSWPEKGYINIDIVTCSKRGVDPVRLADLFVELFHPTSLRCHKIYF
jgi:S-adenosylmethionine decarboxylase proenzyme